MFDIQTLDYGPIYNPLNKNGLPILGAWEKARAQLSSKALSPEPQQYSSYIPSEGPVILRSVWLDDNKAIRYDCGFKKDFSALLFQEDFEIAEKLIFSEQEALFPNFKKAINGKKIFYPLWLAETDFGRTLYACHHFINALVFHADDFDIASRDAFFNPSWHEPVKDMIGYLPVVSGKSQINTNVHDARVRPLEFKGSIEGDVEVNWSIKNIDLDIGFEVIDRQTGQPVAAISEFFTENRDAFPQLIPNFERLRQLWALLYSLNALKQAGYKL